MAGNVFTISVDHLLGGAVFCCNMYGKADAAHINVTLVQDFLPRIFHESTHNEVQNARLHCLGFLLIRVKCINNVRDSAVAAWRQC
jgi:hypothetical protein